MKPLTPVILAMLVSINAVQPFAQTSKRLVLVGNSMVPAAIDNDTLKASLTNVVVHSSITQTFQTATPQTTVDFGGQSCLWYSVVHRQAHLTTSKPDYLLVVQRRNDITCPNMRIWGDNATKNTKYKSHIDAIIGTSTALRKIVDTVAYNDSIEALPARFPGSKFLGYRGNIHPGSGTYWQMQVDGAGWDFGQANKVSFLPRMVAACKANNVKLILLRHKTWDYFQSGFQEKPEYVKYRQDLTTYCQANGVHLIDYSLEPKITSSWYNTDLLSGHNDHVGTSGRIPYTKLLAEDLRAIFSGSKGPRELTNRPATSVVSGFTPAVSKIQRSRFTLIHQGKGMRVGIIDRSSALTRYRELNGRTIARTSMR